MHLLIEIWDVFTFWGWCLKMLLWTCMDAFMHGGVCLYFAGVSSRKWNCICSFPSGSVVENLSAMQETWVLSLGWVDPLRRKWQPTPLSVPGKFHGQRSLVGYSPWGRRVLDMTEWLSQAHTMIKAGYVLFLFSFLNNSISKNIQL